MTVTHKNNVSKFVGSLLNHLYHYANENVLGTAHRVVLETLGTDFPNTNLLAGK